MTQPPSPHTHRHTMGSKRLALQRDQLGGFSRRICHPSSCRSGGAVGGCWKGIWDEGKICPRRIASAPPSCRLWMGDTQNLPGPRALPLRRLPPRASGGGGLGDALTSQTPSANRSCSFRAPRGFPGQNWDQGRDPAMTTPNLGLKESPHLSGETEAGTRQGGGGTQESLCSLVWLQHGPERGRDRRESHSGVTRRRALMGARRLRGGVFLPRWRQAPGPGSGSAYLGAPKGRLAPSGSPRAPSDPGPQTGRVWAEGVSGCRRPQNPHWIPSGPEQDGSAVLPNPVPVQAGKLRPRGEGLCSESHN